MPPDRGGAVYPARAHANRVPGRVREFSPQPGSTWVIRLRRDDLHPPGQPELLPTARQPEAQLRMRVPPEFFALAPSALRIGANPQRPIRLARRQTTDRTLGRPSSSTVAIAAHAGPGCVFGVEGVSKFGEPGNHGVAANGQMTPTELTGVGTWARPTQ